MSTNERFTYDGMFRIVCGEDPDIFIYDETTNPLGIEDDRFEANFRSHPKILEYKLDLDGLIEDVESDSKNTNDIDLLVAWSVGENYKNNYNIVSYLDPDNISDRQFHGVTHALYSSAHHQKEMDLIILRDLIDYLNDTENAVIRQRKRFEED